MTSTDTLLPCPFCGGAAEMRGGGMINCQRCGAEAFGPKWQRRTPPTPAAEEREAVAQWCSGCHEVRSVDCYRAGCPKSDTERRAAEILAAEARGYAKAIEDAANEARDLWEYGIPSQEFPRRIRAIEHGAGK